MTIADRYGLPVSTSSPIAAGHYQEGMDAALAALVCHLRLGRLADAVRLLRRRLDRRPSPPDLSWLGQAQAGIADGARRG
jgi:hypothetical protein